MKRSNSKKIQNLKLRQEAPMKTPTDLGQAATKDIAGARAVPKDQELPLAHEQTAFP